jgi:hypothetical protein
MKRQLRATGISADATQRPVATGLQATSSPTKSAGDALPRYCAEAGPDSKVWTRYIDSRMKQFCAR